MSRPHLTIVLPFVFIGALQLVSCKGGEVAPAQPGGAYLSTSGGAKFEQSVDLVDQDDQLIGHIDKLNLSSIHRPQHSPSTIFLTANSKGVVVSHDDGESWQPLSIPLARVTAFVNLPNDIWLASGTNADNEGVAIRSLDQGKSWNKVLTIPAAKKEKAPFFQIVKPPPPPAIYVSSLVPDPFIKERVYATTSTGDVLAGEESGKVWHKMVHVQAAKVNPLTGYSNELVRRIIPSPHKQGELLLITGEGNLVIANEEEYNILKLPRGQVIDTTFIQPYPDAILASLTTGIFISRDNGTNWQQLNVPISQSQAYKQSVVRVSPTNPNRLIVSVNSIIYRSEDGGNNWNTLSLELPNFIITDISINPDNASRVLLTTIPTQT